MKLVYLQTWKNKHRPLNWHIVVFENRATAIQERRLRGLKYGCVVNRAPHRPECVYEKKEKEIEH